MSALSQLCLPVLRFQSKLVELAAAFAFVDRLPLYS